MRTLPRIAPLAQKTLLGSLGAIWAADEALCALVPARRVVTGRIPSAQEFVMPYVSIMQGPGHRRHRTNVNQYDVVPALFHLWVPEAQLGLGEQIDQAISEAYANRNWRYMAGRVIDVLDEGPAGKMQVPRPDYKQWEIVKLFSLCVVRVRPR